MIDSTLNTQFEISLRVLLMLESIGELTAEMIAVADFITVYGKEFGISYENLHGDNNYKFSEFPLRRELVIKSIRQLVLDDLVKVHPTKNGFIFSLNQKGTAYCAKFTSTYANAYRRIATHARTYIANRSERDMLHIINQLSVSSLQRRGIIG